MSESRTEAEPTLVADLAAADEAYREAAAAVDEVGEDRLERVADAYDRATDLLGRYEEPASGSGRETFEKFVEFQGLIAEFPSDLPDDLPEREAFEEMADFLDQRRLSEDDFERAREIIAPAADLVSRLDDRDEALARYRRARHAVEARLRELDDEIADLEATLAFADVDLDAPVGELRGPIAAYNDAVRDAFAAFRAEAPAREVLDFVAATEAYPLVPFRTPPESLKTYLDDRPVGGEPIPTLLDYADYSRSKLGHYVDDPGTFKARVGADRTYLERLDAGPLEIDWPPPSAADLRWRLRELVAAADRFAPDAVIERLRDVRDLARDPDYERLRTAARAHEELADDERERLETGAAERDLADLREERERLADALDRYPER